MSTKPSIVIVEDDALIAFYLKGLCKNFGAEVLGTAPDGDKAIEIISEKTPTHVLMDMRLKGERDGVDVGREIQDKWPDVKVIFVTGSNEPTTRSRMENEDPHGILIKPINPIDLQDALRSDD